MALPVQPTPAFDAEAVTSEVVVAARRADQSPRWVGLQPALTLSSVPDAVFRSEHPAASLTVEHGEVSDGKPERARHESACPPLLGKELVPVLGFCEGIDRHGESIARGGWPMGWV